MKKQRIMIFVLFLVVFMFNCRTMMLNQTAETIKPKATEITVSTGIGGSIAQGAGLLLINEEFQHRIGIAKNIEFQYYINGNYMTYGYGPVGVAINHRLSPKFQLLESKNNFFSISPTIGVFTLFNFMSFSDRLLPRISPTIGLNIIGSNKFKGDICSIYYGFDFEVGDIDMYPKIIGYLESSDKNYNIYFDPDFSFNFVLGLEINKNNLIIRHELDTTLSIEMIHNDYYNSIIPIISIAYNFSIGGIIEPKIK